MKSLGDDSLPIDVTRDERIDSNRMVSSGDSNMLPPQTIEESFSPEHIHQNYVEYIKKYTPDNVDIARHPINIGYVCLNNLFFCLTIIAWMTLIAKCFLSNLAAASCIGRSKSIVFVVDVDVLYFVMYSLG